MLDCDSCIYLKRLAASIYRFKGDEQSTESFMNEMDSIYEENVKKCVDIENEIVRIKTASSSGESSNETEHNLISVTFSNLLVCDSLIKNCDWTMEERIIKKNFILKVFNSVDTLVNEPTFIQDEEDCGWLDALMFALKILKNFIHQQQVETQAALYSEISFHVTKTQTILSELLLVMEPNSQQRSLTKCFLLMASIWTESIDEAIDISLENLKNITLLYTDRTVRLSAIALEYPKIYFKIFNIPLLVDILNDLIQMNHGYKSKSIWIQKIDELLLELKQLYLPLYSQMVCEVLLKFYSILKKPEQDQNKYLNISSYLSCFLSGKLTCFWRNPIGTNYLEKATQTKIKRR